MSKLIEVSEKMGNDEYLTKKQAADLLQVSLRSIEAYSAKERFPTIRISTRKVLYPKRGIQEWLKSRQSET
jgi:predicted DNA-binding transcriptional regulator AlpA